MLTNASMLFAAAVLFGFSTYLGLIPMHRMIQRREAQHELRSGSASYLRRTGGLLMVAAWLATLFFAATILGDWGFTGDLDAALGRAGERVALMVRLAASAAGGR